MNKFSLDIEPVIDFGNTAFLHFATLMPGYELVDDLNHLYRLALAREGNIELDGQQWPLYFYHDARMWLHYFLLEVPAGCSLPLLHEGEKVLIVRGRDADECVLRIDDDFKSPPAVSFLPDAERRRAIINRYQQMLTPVNIIRFSDSDTAAAASRRRKSLKGPAALADLFARILDYVDCAFAIE